MYLIELSQLAQRFLESLDNPLKKRVEDRLKNLRENPFPSDSRFIGRIDNEKVFRYRIGKYRALYKVKESNKIILVSKIDKRSKVYD